MIRQKLIHLLRSSAAVLLPLLPGVLAIAQPPSKQADGIVLTMPAGLLKIQVLSETVVRIAFAKDASFFTRPVLDVVPQPAPFRDWKLGGTADMTTVSTARLQVVVDRRAGAVRFLDPAGNPIASEVPGGRVLEPAEVQGEKTWHVQQRWGENAGESLYGLGQRQFNTLDIKGYDLDLWQHNTNIAVPFLVSSRGYGVLWENTSLTRFGDLRPFTAIPPEYLFDAAGAQGGLTVRPIDGSEPGRFSSDLQLDLLPQGEPQPPVKNTRWEGSIAAPVTGDYQFQTFANGGIKVWIDGKLVFDHWRQGWLAAADQVKIPLEGGRRYPIRIEWDTEQGSTMKFAWKTPDQDRSTSLWSEVGDGIDYYFVYGPKLDDVIAGYRQLTGRAPMMPAWVFGLWQSRQRYETAQQSLDVVREYRRRQIPFDNIVQDWQYWPIDSWGSHQFDPARFPDPDGWIKAIHDQHAHLMISVWPKFYPTTANAKELMAHGFLYQSNLQLQERDWLGYVATDYDAFNPAARDLYWSQIDKNLFRRGIDAWWMDASEPDCTPSPTSVEDQRRLMNPTALGTASRMLNGFALMNSEAIYEGQRRAAPNQRVFLLTRSGYAGQQRYAAASWSGDITSTWTALARQIPAGLGFSLSGVPYWTTDTGGYTMQDKFSTADMKPADQEEWRELNARWFEFSTFTPLLRVHGELRFREMWTMGGDASPAYQAEMKFDRLRYRMLPYIYSLAGAVTRRDATILRPLVMDFPGDQQARELADQFLFGPAFLVAPITKYQARSRAVYLPPAAAWYDLWTGQKVQGGAMPNAAAPYDQIPVYVRAGSIIPYGPDIQYTGQRPADPLTVYVYAGADGDFTLYEDEGTNYNYEQGAFSEIALHWDDQAQSLTVGDRHGSYAGMPQHRAIEVVLVSAGHPVGFSFAPQPARRVEYGGKALTLSLK
ncbi:MAG: TIM-barrel domain-containing protein [Bryobacteraceae bacterium]|jgi:alpha-D-xyloside xylohydrolase